MSIDADTRFRRNFSPRGADVFVSPSGGAGGGGTLDCPTDDDLAPQCPRLIIGGGGAWGTRCGLYETTCFGCECTVCTCNRTAAPTSAPTAHLLTGAPSARTSVPSTRPPSSPSPAPSLGTSPPPTLTGGAVPTNDSGEGDDDDVDVDDDDDDDDDNDDDDDHGFAYPAFLCSSNAGVGGWTD